MDYKNTLNLPNTDFQMKADLQSKEPATLERWNAEGLYSKIRKQGAGREKFILHDGPPYANGNIHIGHALNKLLKDFVVKSKFMQGYATDYVPGWDCHGLPIELQVEKELGGKKSGLTKAGIRKKCRAYAEKFVSIQREDFKRLGVFGDWDNPYLTMEYGYQASILREIGRFAEKGLIYKGKKPVHWCSSCVTALAEAEVEYADKTSPSVYVKFRVKTIPERLGKQEALIDAIQTGDCYFVIWTTTPWTLPANLAIAVGADITYQAVEVEFESIRQTWIVAADLADAIVERSGAKKLNVSFSSKGDAFEGIVCTHPFIDRDSPVYLGEHVTTDAGSGCVHIAPGHGQEDYELGLKHGLDIYNPVDDFGKFTNDVPEFSGQFVFKANDGVIELLKTKRALIARDDITHSYPHCWRCKKPIIFRATSQWFASMEAGDLRKLTLDAIDKSVKWIPSWGRDRIYNMIASRPDWCLSRQRAWGVPIPALVCDGCNKSFLDKNAIDHLAAQFEEHGADIWFEREVKDLVPPGTKCPDCGGADLRKEENILDVWFDSGVSFAAVLERRANLKFPADMYLEGSDQHRGWFHSSILASIGTRATPPYKTVLTHGFVVDGSGRKMSKSVGNVIAPQEVIGKYGAEVLRLWVAAEDYREDIRISEEILKRLAEAYRRIRNTFRYILGNLGDFDPEKDAVAYDDLLELDKLTLHKLARLTQDINAAYDSYEFHKLYHGIHNFCSVDLSAFYLDILKDRLYTSGAKSKARRAAQTTIYYVLDHLVRLTAPVLVFTSEEAWQFMPGRTEGSVHLSSMPKPDKAWFNEELDRKWAQLLKVKGAISIALEQARQNKVIGHSLDAKVSISTNASRLKEAAELMRLDMNAERLAELIKSEEAALKDMLIVSQIESSDYGDTKGFLSITKAEGQKCERCWHYSEKVGTSNEHPTICPRCTEALK